MSVHETPEAGLAISAGSPERNRSHGRHTADVVVIGAGIVGASCAFHLAERGLSVAVVEREGAPALGSTGRSAAGVRVQFTTDANIAFSMHSLPLYRDFRDRHGFEIGYRDIGYLLLVPPERWDAHLDAVARQRTQGAPVEVLAPDDVARFLPLATEGLAGATYGPLDGVIDPHLATHAWVSMARAQGVACHFNTRVTGIERTPGSWRIVCDRSVFSCSHIVNAAGAWSGLVGQLAGLEVPVRPKRIQIFLSGPIADSRVYPMTIDLATGVYLRSEGDRILFGRDTHDDDGFTEGVDWDWLEEVLLAGVTRFPWWEDLGVDRGGSWWGYYGVTPDHNPVIGLHPDASRWVDACGFSGHGIMHAPATGLCVAELIADGRTGTLDATAFRHGRFDTVGVPREANIF